MKIKIIKKFDYLSWLIKLFKKKTLFVPSDPGVKSPVYLANSINAEHFSLNINGQAKGRNNSWGRGLHRAIPRVEQINLDLMHNNNYLNFLVSKNYNLSVVLGEISNNICTIDLDDIKFENEIFKLNKFFLKTLITKGKRGKQIWFRTKEKPPSPVYISDQNKNNLGEFRSTGWCTMVYGIHPSGISYSIINESNPIEISFKDIKWPSNVKFSRFYFSGRNYPMDLIEKRKSYKDIIVIEKKMLDCDINDYTHFAFCYLDKYYKEIFRYDAFSAELLKSYKECLGLDYLKFERYFELPECPQHLCVEPYSETKSYRRKIMFYNKEIEEKQFSLQEKINANWAFC